MTYTTTTQLEVERAKLLKKLSFPKDMRRGSITECYRRCGKPTCACASPGHPGHGPYYAFTRKVNGKTKTKQLRSGPELVKLQKEVDNYKRFKKTCEQLFDVNEKICDAKCIESEMDKKKRLSKVPSKAR